jgi:stage V sporulation protein AB
LILSKYIFLAFIGIVAGFVIAAGLFAFMTMIGVLTRLAIRTNTSDHVLLYEDIVIVGATLGNILFLFEIKFFIGAIGLLLFGFFSGCYVGCLAAALEEVLQVFPILSRRIKLKIGMPFIILALAIGKGIGTFYQLFIKG